MTLRSKLEKAKAQGYIRSFELLFNRFVPPWVFRYSKGAIFDLNLDQLAALNEQSGRELGGGLVTECLVDADSSDESKRCQRERLREFTWNSVPLETTKNDFGYAIYDSQNPEKILGGVWVGRGSFLEEDLGLKFILSEHQTWLYCAFVDSDARGRGVYKKLLSFVAQDVKQRGYSQLLTVINPWNRISTSAHQKQSKRVCGSVSSMRAFWLAWVSRSGSVQIDKRLLTDIKRDPAKVTIN